MIVNKKGVSLVYWVDPWHILSEHDLGAELS
jgi:hypothetical protein